MSMTCDCCGLIESTFACANAAPHLNYYPVLTMLESLEKQRRIELYAADCKLSDAVEVLNSEQHYTVCHYFKCTRCGQLFFLGACVRGTPKFKKIDDIKSINFSNMIWGNIGTRYFQQK